MPVADLETEPSTTAIDAVFEKLLADIVGGTYRSGTRLPAERELSRLLGASRPTLREALRRLGEW
ncbi:MAG: GntR family transcriptional regulator, partial [Kofleriaceae bacterium]|nr:GntR family transcriptional regulator [Kofleriaceae bacterium]